MHLAKSLRPLTASVAISAILLLNISCSPTTAASHPNQINAFDGQTYDSLLAARAVLVGMGPAISATYPQYKPAYNSAVTAYGTAVAAYTAFRVAPANEAAVLSAIATLTPAIAALEQQIQADLHPTPAQVATATKQVKVIRARLPSGTQAHFKSNLSLQDILYYIEIAASVASLVPGAGAYAQIATILIQTAIQAEGAISANSGLPINLALLIPIATL